MALRLISANLNGIRSAATKGFFDWAAQSGADCMGVQEVRAQPEDLAGRFEAVAGAQGALRGHFHLAERKGYSGVGLYSRHAPSEVLTGFGHRGFDAEGRWVELR
ncbi:MAG: endonuclease/exonuclease/phosphatase family protein, partial [Rubrivivax sp.]